METKEDLRREHRIGVDAASTPEQFCPGRNGGK